MGKNRSETSRSSQRNNNQTPNSKKNITIGDTTITLPLGVSKSMLDQQLTRRLIGDAERNRYTDEVGYRSPGNPTGELWDLYETEPWNSVFPEFGTFRTYYEQKVEPKMLQTRQNMMKYLKDHPDRDIVTSYGWLNGNYPDQQDYEN